MVCSGSLLPLFLFLLTLSRANAQSSPACVGSQHYRTIPRADRCAYGVRAPKVALLFLVRGNIPHEALWRRWFEEVDGTVFSGCAPRGSDKPATCSREERSDPIARQELFSVFVHSSPDFPGYPGDSLFHGGRRRAQRWLPGPCGPTSVRLTRAAWLQATSCHTASVHSGTSSGLRCLRSCARPSTTQSTRSLCSCRSPACRCTQLPWCTYSLFTGARAALMVRSLPHGRQPALHCACASHVCRCCMLDALLPACKDTRRAAGGCETGPRFGEHQAPHRQLLWCAAASLPLSQPTS